MSFSCSIASSQQELIWRVTIPGQILLPVVNETSTLMPLNETSNENSTVITSYITAYPIDNNENFITSVLEITVVPEIANNRITVECSGEDIDANVSILINSGEHKLLFWFADF